MWDKKMTKGKREEKKFDESLFSKKKLP